jgi:activator of the mannose operon (transcriptional antiterminator)
MNDRQRKILRILLEETTEYLSSQQIADRLECSEKTVRNDSKLVDEWLEKHSNASITRKPNTGFFLEIGENERNVILEYLNKLQNGNVELDEEKRLLQVLEWLLIENKHLTIHGLSETFYVNKVIVKKDLEKIKSFLQKFNLIITTKQKSGIEIEGKEQDFRAAIVQIPKFLGEQSVIKRGFLENLFELHEIQAVTHGLEEMNQRICNTYTDETLQNLLMHILITIKRIKLGKQIELTNSEVEQIMKKKEYGLAVELMNVIEKSFAIRVPEIEIAYITMHLMGGKVQNASTENENDLDDDVKVLTENLIQRISKISNLQFSSDRDLYTNLGIHLQSSMNRIMHGLIVTNPILEDIKRMYPYLFNIIFTELVHINKQTPYSIPEEEAAYITLHFQASLEGLQKRNGKNKRVIIVCPLGIGASMLLRAKLERKFHSLEIVDSVSVNKVCQYSNKEIDIIISTIPMNHPFIPIIVVSPLLSDKEQYTLQTFIENLDLDHSQDRELKIGKHYPYLRNFLREELIFLDIDVNHRFEVIEILATALAEQGYVTKEYIESAVIRERYSSTSIGGGVAIPHGDPLYINKSGIAVGVLKKPVEWGNDSVSFVLLLATKQEDHTNTKKLFSEIGELSENPILISNVIKQKHIAEFTKYF